MKASLALALVACLCFLSSAEGSEGFSFTNCTSDFVYGYSLGLQVSQNIQGVCLVGFTSLSNQYNSFLNSISTYEPFENTAAFIALFNEMVTQLNRCSAGDFLQTIRNMFITTWEILGVTITSRVVTSASTLANKAIQFVQDIGALNCSGVGQGVGYLMRTLTGFNLP